MSSIIIADDDLSGVKEQVSQTDQLYNKNDGSATKYAPIIIKCYIFK